MIKNSFVTGILRFNLELLQILLEQSVILYLGIRVSRNLFSSSFNVYVNYFLKVFET